MICPKAIERILRACENPKAIMVLRHPVDRTFSHWQWRVKLGVENRRLIDACREDGFGYSPGKRDRGTYMAYLQFSQYAKYVPMWLGTFGEERCLLLSSQGLRCAPEWAMRQCFDFLEIPNSTAVEGRFVNKTEACVMRPTNNMTKLAAFLPNRLRRSTVFKSVRHQALKYLTPSLPEEINADERNFLEEQLAEDIEWFHERFKIRSFANFGEAE